MAADGALDQRGQLAAAQRRQGCPASCCATAWRTSPAAPTRVCFFQWRASRAGAEKFHSALVPHAGTDTRVWREVVELGATLGRARRGRRLAVRAEVARRLFDWEAWWASELDCAPQRRRRPTSTVPTPSTPRCRCGRGVTVDVVHPEADLVRLPPGGGADALPRAPTPARPTRAAYVEGGGTCVVTYFSGIVDENDHVRLGGYPGAFRELLGVRDRGVLPAARRASRCTLDDGC